jgi:membrane-bound metal-dependent hydrolase YbcI (DUF457 family)
VILTIIAVDLYRDYITKHKKYFTLLTILVAGIAGLLPDIDIPLSFVFSSLGIENGELLQHGGITHTPFFGLLFLIPFSIFWKMKKHRLAIIFAVIAFGVVFHSFLDLFIGGGHPEGVMALYPFSEQRFDMFLLLIYGFPAIPALDAIILLAWLVHEERKHKIKDFI